MRSAAVWVEGTKRGHFKDAVCFLTVPATKEKGNSGSELELTNVCAATLLR